MRKWIGIQSATINMTQACNHNELYPTYCLKRVNVAINIKRSNMMHQFINGNVCASSLMVMYYAFYNMHLKVF